MERKDIKKAFIARNTGSIVPDASQMVVAFAEGDTIGTQVSPETIVGLTVTGYEFVETNVGKTLFLYFK